MMKKVENNLYYSILILTILNQPVVAEVITDGTVGDQGVVEVAGPDYQIDAELGEVHGANLFHSFSRFNVETNSSATFTANGHSAGSINNVIARVTDGRSYVNGELNSDIAGANLWLLNPRGVIFGDQASINLSGSFYMAAGQSIQFDDGRRFSGSSSTPEMTGATPTGFYLSGTGGLDIHAETLTNTGQDITLAGSYVNLTDSVVSADRINIQAGNNITVSRDGIETRAPATGEIKLNQSRLHSDGRGVFIRSGTIRFNDSSVSLGARAEANVTMLADLLNIRSHHSEQTAAINVDIQNSRIAPVIVRLSARRLTLEQGASIRVNADGLQGSGAVALDGDLVKLDDADIELNSLRSAGEVNLSVNARNINIVNGSQIIRRQSGYSAGGSAPGYIRFEADEKIVLLAGARIVDESARTGISNSDELLLMADYVLIDDSQVLSTAVAGAGSRIRLSAQGGAADTLLLIRNDARIQSDAVNGARSGAVLLEGDEIYISGGSLITATADDRSVSGYLNVQAGKRLGMQESTITAKSGATLAATGSVSLFNMDLHSEQGAIGIQGVRSEEAIPGVAKPVEPVPPAGSSETTEAGEASVIQPVSSTAISTDENLSGGACVTRTLPGGGNRGYFLETASMQLGNQEMDLFWTPAESSVESTATTQTYLQQSGIAMSGAGCR